MAGDIDLEVDHQDHGYHRSGRLPDPSSLISNPVDDLCQLVLASITATNQSLQLYLCGRALSYDQVTGPSDLMGSQTATLEQFLTNVPGLPKWTLNQRMALSFNIIACPTKIRSRRSRYVLPFRISKKPVNRMSKFHSHLSGIYSLDARTRLRDAPQAQGTAS
ncbi:predicted protein [Uncinocarpus reesii 1704]|uniref:Uncharacterized protein n=1 Tax=Uncinocarpus reesii (strain UAMH 1704) TaxID=336963 RepID=C4JSA1_UNCRE|nr:uncharacterized protein UREG_05340 [Uncinocarpus reesii 1704]EEP80498.1 predicted protein [Uncinocarpus reesii 1704]